MTAASRMRAGSRGRRLCRQRYCRQASINGVWHGYAMRDDSQIWNLRELAEHYPLSINQGIKAGTISLYQWRATQRIVDIKCCHRALPKIARRASAVAVGWMAAFMRREALVVRWPGPDDVTPNIWNSVTQVLIQSYLRHEIINSSIAY